MKNLGIWQFAGFVIATAIGTVLHFLFDWTGSLVVAPFAAVNESTWEHMKILFFPMLAFALVQWLCWNGRFVCLRGTCAWAFWWVKLIGTAVGVVAIPVLFYGIGGAFGEPSALLNIIFFFASAGLGFFVEYCLFKVRFDLPFGWIALGLLVGAAVTVGVFTFLPPRVPLFQDPVTGLFGIV